MRIKNKGKNMSDTLIIILSVSGVMLTLVGVMTSIMIWFFNKIDADVKSAVTRLDGHATRIDQLYQIIVNLLQKKP